MKKILVIFTILFFSNLVCQAQEKIYMPYFEIINMHKDYQYATSRLLKMYLEQENKYELVFPIKDTIYYNESKEKTILKAKELKINHILIGELNRIGEMVIVSISMYNTETEEKEWNALQKANTPEDLDPIMQKIALSLNGKISIDETKDIYNVTDYESKELNKMIANTYLGIEIGGGAAFGEVKNNFPAGLSGVFSGDMRTIIFDIKGNLYFSDIKLYNVSIHINYPFSQGKSTPFLGGGLGYGGTTMTSSEEKTTQNWDGSTYTYTDETNRSGAGLSLFAGGGYIFNRTSNINLRLNANFFFSCYKVDGGFPAGILLSMSVLF